MALELARQKRDVLVNEVGLSRRLASRVGSLLGRGVACTVTVLEEVEDHPLLGRLLLDGRMRHVDAAALPGVMEELSACEEYGGMASDLGLVVVEQDGLQVIALDEEVEAEAAFAQREHEVEQLPAPRGIHAVSTPAAGRGTAGLDAAFSEERLAELRVTVFAGETSAERVSALRKIGLAPLPASERIGVFVQALGEEDLGVRASAATGLQRLGLPGGTAEALRLLAEGDVEERLYACGRLGKLEAAAEAWTVDACLMGLLGALRVEREAAVSAALVNTLAHLAPRVPEFRSAAPEIMRLLVECVVHDMNGLSGPVRAALLAFEDAVPGLAVSYLIREAAETADPLLRAFLVSVAVSGRAATTQREALLTLAADTLMELPAEASEAHPLATFLTRQGDDGVREILTRLRGASTAHQRFLIRRVDDAVRFQELGEETCLAVAEATKALLTSGARQLCADVFETRLSSPVRLPDGLCAQMAEALLHSVRQFALPQVQENAEACLARLGVGAVPALVSSVEERLGSLEGEIACRALGRIARALDREDGGVEALREGVRRLHAISFSERGGRREVFVTLGQVCGTGLLQREDVAVVRRNLLNRLSGQTKDAPLIEALGWLVSADGEDSHEVEGVAELAMVHLERGTPDSTIEVQFEDGEEIFCFGGEFDVFSDLLPACLVAIERILLAKATSEELRTSLLQRLLQRWVAATSYQVQWSPGNVAQLTEVLGRVGQSEMVDRRLRVEVIHTLARRLGDMPVMEVLAGIVAAGGPDPELDRLAAAVAMRVLEYMADDPDLGTEDRENYLFVLGRVAGRGRFEVRSGGGERLLRRVIDEIVLGVRDGVPGALRILVRLNENEAIPEAQREFIAAKIREHSSLVRQG